MNSVEPAQDNFEAKIGMLYQIRAELVEKEKLFKTAASTLVLKNTTLTEALEEMEQPVGHAMCAMIRGVLARCEMMAPAMFKMNMELELDREFDDEEYMKNPKLERLVIWMLTSPRFVVCFYSMDSVTTSNKNKNTRYTTSRLNLKNLPTEETIRCGAIAKFICDQFFAFQLRAQLVEKEKLFN